jgi:hypothetical protein
VFKCKETSEKGKNSKIRTSIHLVKIQNMWVKMEKVN